MPLGGRHINGGLLLGAGWRRPRFITVLIHFARRVDEGNVSYFSYNPQLKPFMVMTRGP